MNRKMNGHRFRHILPSKIPLPASKIVVADPDATSCVISICDDEAWCLRLRNRLRWLRWLLRRKRRSLRRQRRRLSHSLRRNPLCTSTLHFGFALPPSLILCHCTGPDIMTHDRDASYSTGNLLHPIGSAWFSASLESLP